MKAKMTHDSRSIPVMPQIIFCMAFIQLGLCIFAQPQQCMASSPGCASHLMPTEENYFNEIIF